MLPCIFKGVRVSFDTIAWETGHFAPPSWKFEDIISPQDYLRYSRQWLSQGAQIIGGCCGIGPEHIRELDEKLAG